MNKSVPTLSKFLFKFMEFVWNIIWRFGYDGLKLTMRDFKITDKRTIYGTLTLDGYCYWMIMVRDTRKSVVSKQVFFAIPPNHLEFFKDANLHIIDKTVKEGNIK